jgi:hypothetical protein
MSNVLLSVLAATSLVTAGVPSETRSAQALPAEHLVVPPAHPNSSGNFQYVNRLADPTPGNSWSDQPPEVRCRHHGGHWNAEKQKCEPNAFIYIIGAATLGGFIYAMTSRGGSSNGPLPISN